MIEAGFIIGLFSASIRLATPILLAALGEIYVERSGVLNIGIEGMMLMGALLSFLGAYISGNLWLGLLWGAGSGAVMGLIMAFLSVTLRANQVVAGIALNIFSFGATTFIYRLLFGTQLIPPIMDKFPALNLPLLSDIPIIGPILFRQIALVYITFALVPAAWLVLFRTPLGLSIRAVGERPMAADTVGINVYAVRYLCVILGGIAAALGGAVLALGQMGLFVENLTAGRGFIALAIVIFSKWEPFRALGAAILFGAADALQLRLQAMGVGVPFQLLLMLPYLLTVIVLVGVVGKAVAPAGLLIPYKKEEPR